MSSSASSSDVGSDAGLQHDNHSIHQPTGATYDAPCLAHSIDEIRNPHKQHQQQQVPPQFAEDNNLSKSQASSLLQHSGLALELPQTTICVAQVLLQQVMRCAEDKDATDELRWVPRKEWVKVSLLVATKTQETYRKLRDIFTVVEWAIRAEDNEIVDVVELASPEYRDLRESLIYHEVLFLRVLGFDVDVVLPHHFLFHFLHALKGSEDVAAVSWCILNDAMETSLMLDFEPHIIACGAIYLAAELLSANVSQGDEEWWTKFSTRRTQVEDVCHKMLNFYDEAKLGCEGEANEGPRRVPTSQNPYASASPHLDYFSPLVPSRYEDFSQKYMPTPPHNLRFA